MSVYKCGQRSKDYFMSLITTIDNDLKSALKQRDQVKLGTLRMLKSALYNQEIADKKETLDDKETVLIIRRELKKRQDSITSFEQGNRQDLADKEKLEAAILEKYMPAQISEADIARIVAEVIASGVDNFGQVMKEVMTKTQGQADGQIVQKLVKEKLNN